MTLNGTKAFRHKSIAALLSFFLGWAGAHWWYLGRRLPWLPLVATLTILLVASLRTTPFYSQITYYLVLVPIMAGVIESWVLCLMSDERFDARYNSGHSRRSKTGWGPVLLAMFFLLAGTGFLMGHVVMLSLEMAAGTLTL